MSADDMSLGAAIAAARRASGLSVVEVSNRTRIRRTVIEAMEADDFSHCGGDVYARGHLRAIASAVGVDATPWIRSYDEQFGTRAPSPTEVFEADMTAPPRRRGANWSAVMAVALVIAVALGIAQIATSSDDGGRAPTTVAEPNSTSSPEPTKSDEPSDDPSTIAEADPPKEVVVRMTALPGEVSWVSVTSADSATPLFEGNLSNGQTRMFRDNKEISVLSGCASAIEFVVNGQDIGSPGATCGPKSVSFTPKDPPGAAG